MLALSAMLLDSIIETHAWAAARPKHESQTAAQKYEQKISEVMNVEREQGTFTTPPTSSSLSVVFVGRPRSNSALLATPSCNSSVFFDHLRPWYSPPCLSIPNAEKTRERLNHFVTQMKTALAALTGISSI